MATEVQTVIVSKTVARNRATAARIAREVTGRGPRTSRETESSYRFRQFNPARCVERTERTYDVEGREGVRVVVCELRRE